MKQENLNEMLELVEDQYIDEAMEPAVKRSKSRYIGLAASILLFLCCGSLLWNLRNHAREDKFRDARISVGDIEKNGYTSNVAVFAGGAGTSSYFIEYAQNLKDIMLSPIKDNQDIAELKVYRAKHIDNVQACFDEKVNVMNHRLAVELGIQSKEEDRENKVQDAYSYNSTDLITKNFKINIETQNSQWTVETRYRIWDAEPGLGALALFGDEVIISENDSDDSIKKSLKDILEFANTIFQKNCKIQRITRDYESGRMISVNAYEDSDLLDQTMYNQYFNNIDFLFMDDNEGGDIKLIGIYYTEYEIEDAFTSSEPLVSVKQAQEYLKNGYIFLGHVCPVCMSGNEVVDFSDYDGIEVVYRPEYFSNFMIPFYAFYKQTGENHYAVTYVPAVKVAGLEEYFKEQEAWHEE